MDGAASHAASIGKQTQATTMIGSKGVGAGPRAAAPMRAAQRNAVSTVDPQIATACRLVGSVRARMAR